MRALCGVLAAVGLVLPLAACSEDEPIIMPEVVGKSLDVANSDVQRAGFDDELEVLGGGLLGIVDESNWTVCSQEPAGGSEITSVPRLTVDRTCEEDEEPQAADQTSEESTTNAEAAPATAEDSTTPEADPTETEDVAPTETEDHVPEESTEVLTVDNNADLAALLAGGSSDWDAFEDFATKYEGQLLELDLWVSDIQPHGDYETRFDYLLYSGRYDGDFEASYRGGPSFKFEDVNYFDLALIGSNKPDTVGLYENLHVVAELEEVDQDTGVFFLEPVSTEVE